MRNREGARERRRFPTTTTTTATQRKKKLAVVVDRKSLSPDRRPIPSLSLTHLSAGVPAPFPLVGPARPGGRRQVAQAEALAGRGLRGGGGGDEDDAAAGDDRRRASRRRRRRRERRAAVGGDGRQLFFRFNVIKGARMRVDGSVVSGLEWRKRGRRPRCGDC